MVEENGNIWLIGPRGIDIIDSAYKTIGHLGNAEGLQSDLASDITKDKTDKIWIGFYDVGVDILDVQKATIQHLGMKQGLKHVGVRDIKEDKEGNVWIVTGNRDMYLYIVDPQNNTIKNLVNMPPSPMDTTNRVLFADEQGNMWIGTPEGIYVANAKKDSLTIFSTREGLLDNGIYSLNEYSGKMYVATGRGLNVLTPPSSSQGRWQVESFGKPDGINKLSFDSYESNLITKKGKFIWGDWGVTFLDNHGGNIAAPATYITGIDITREPKYFAGNFWGNANKIDTLWSANKDTFYVNGQLPINSGFVHQKGIYWDSIAGAFNTPANLHVPYDQNHLQFHFAQANLGSKDIVRYQYILEGIDKKWSRTSDAYTENYLNLSPGNYTFKVSSLYLGAWSRPATFSFTITPPWWKTLWAYALYALVVLAIMSMIIRYRSRQLIRQNKILEEKVANRTSQLNKSLEELKATQAQLIQSEKMASLGELTAGIAHEIQNPLNFVNNFSEVNYELISELVDEVDKGNIDEVKLIAADIQDNSEKINYHGKRADSIVKGMLQHSRASSGQKELTDINKLADEYLRLSYHGMRARDKSFNAEMKTDFDDSIGKISVVPQDIGRVILNIINNAFYAVNEKKNLLGLEDLTGLNNYQPVVSVQTKKLNEKVEIKVSDNGNGIPQSIVDKIFQPFFTTKPTGEGTGLGLSLSYDIIKAHGGEIKVETNEAKGGKFIIQLPIN
jgi:signal transduction histidine kinase